MGIDGPMFRKFEVTRTDGQSAPGQKHHNCKYFVLDLDHDPYAKAAMIAYATACMNTHPQLARDILAMPTLGLPNVRYEPVQAAPVGDAYVEFGLGDSHGYWFIGGERNPNGITRHVAERAVADGLWRVMP